MEMAPKQTDALFSATWVEGTGGAGGGGALPVASRLFAAMAVNVRAELFGLSLAAVFAAVVAGGDLRRKQTRNNHICSHEAQKHKPEAPIGADLQAAVTSSLSLETFLKRTKKGLSVEPKRRLSDFKAKL